MLRYFSLVVLITCAVGFRFANKPPFSPLRLYYGRHDDMMVPLSYSDSYRATLSSTAFGTLSAVSSVLLVNTVYAVNGVDAATTTTTTTSTFLGSMKDEKKFTFLEKRVNNEDDGSLFSPGYVYEDICYPSWFNGVWDTKSTTRQVVAPLGKKIFGGEAAYSNALNDVNRTINYESRFLDRGHGEIIADRIFNIKSIGAEAMGKDAIVDLKQRVGQSLLREDKVKYYNSLSKELNIAISPDAVRGDIFDVNLITEDRDAAINEKEDAFVVLEKSIQTISVRIDALAQNPPLPRIKEIETITLYRQLDDGKRISAVQRTATFLSKLDRSVRYRQIAHEEPRIAHTAVDIRKYDVEYVKKE
jgi:hypothetical protein